MYVLKASYVNKDKFEEVLAELPIQNQVKNINIPIITSLSLVHNCSNLTISRYELHNIKIIQFPTIKLITLLHTAK